MKTNENIQINLNGHFYCSDLQHAEYYIQAIRDRFDLEFLLGKSSSKRIKAIGIDCPNCESSMSCIVDKDSIKIETPCPNPNGLPLLKTLLNVPSGYMVAGNDFRRGFRVIGDYNINKTIGIMSTIKQYADVGLAHGFVGNTCPSINKINLSSFVLGCDGDKKKMKGKSVGGICTDLWWYSIADKDEWERRFGKKINEVDDDVFLVKCKPGLYEFNYIYHLVDHEDYKNPQVFVEINKIGPATEIKDYKSEWDSLNFTAEQIFHHYFRTKSDFYGNPENFPEDHCYAKSVAKNYETVYPLGPHQDEWSYYFLADIILHGLPEGWHKNGWACDVPEIPYNEPEIKIPVFNKPFAWHGDGEYVCSIVQDGVELNPSFARLAFNILQSILRYGVYRYQDKQISKNCSSVKRARKIFNRMAKIYPVPDFCQDLVE